MARVVDTSTGVVHAQLRRVQGLENTADPAGIPDDADAGQMGTGGDLIPFSGFAILTLAAGSTHNFELQYANNNLTGTTTNVIRVQRQRLILMKVG
jgi:hypothetical protein